MKSVLLITFAIAVCSASVLVDPYKAYEEGDRYFYFPGDGDGIMHLVDTQEPVDEDFINSYTRNSADNGYWLFTRNNPNTAQILLINNPDSVQNSNFDAAKDTVFLAHGWNGNGGNGMNLQLREAFLQDGDVNVIILDWNRLANRNYLTAKAGVAEVGRGLGQFIRWLTTQGLSLEKVHLVGFSLGGHLVGNAGRELGGAVKRITALDPAGPLFYTDSNRLAKSDAQYVEVMHTSTNLGYTDPCGDADFYPNGGTSMPGCFISNCSHGKAFGYMAASVKYNHLLANECESHRDASRDRCTGELYEMGNSDLNKSRSGIFRVNTARNYPY